MEQFLLNWGHVVASLHGGFMAISAATLGFGTYLLVKREKIDWNSGAKTSLVGTVSFLFASLMGLLLFPKFRMEEGMFFDPAVPWQSALFVLREELVVIGIFVALLLLLYFLVFRVDEEEKPVKQSFLNLVFILFFLSLAITLIIFLLMLLKLSAGAGIL